ncbi:MAG: hypothetical protein ACE5FH_10410, partial [Candidatus Zixiibacteriota bacterium]
MKKDSLQFAAQCPKCLNGFSIDDLMTNDSIQPIGMELDPTRMTASYCFLHECCSEHSAFSVPVAEFESLI